MRAERAPRLPPGGLAVLAAATYLPLLLTAPGRVGADTKTYLYLEPGRLLSRAWSMWDPSIGLGTVSHQNIGYLWPMGPWYWLFDRAGVPDWVAQRLWLGSILFAAGAGTLWLLRRVLGWSTAPALASAFLYCCTPYVLTLAARISVILLPFAGLPWLIGLAALAVRRGGWRHPAIFALVVATVGSVNATALVLAGLGPVLWLVHARLSGEAATGVVLRAAGRIAAVTLAVNLWWIAGLWAQGSYGIEILRYTETAETVAAAAVAAEVLRGLGYWFFYGGDRLGPWIEPGAQYTQRLPLLGLTYAIPLVAFVAGSFARWRERAFFVALTVVGTLAAVGAHPWDSPPPGGAAVKAFLQSDAGLAMRSLPRAAPLVALGLAALIGGGIAALAARVRPWAAGAAALAAYLALPPLWTGSMVASNLDRDEDLPEYWVEAAAFLDAAGDGTRVLELPGSDFASYRWGNTVDPVTPGLLDRPYVARELIPYGSPASADLLAALDRRIQERTLDPGVLAVVARYLGVGDVVLRGDLEFERFRTPRPYELSPRLHDEPGLGPPVAFGEPFVNAAIPDVPLIDEQFLLLGDARPRPPVEVFPILDPVPIVRARPAAPSGVVVLAGDGEGFLDAAATGILDGQPLVRYAATLDGAELAELLDGGALLVVTDQNREQGRRWSTVRDVLGFVEGEPVLRDDLSDQRLPLFPDADPGWRTTAAPIDGVSAAATSYGNRTTFTPEHRPANAVDGDLRTAWRTAANAPVEGERLRLTYDPPRAASTVTLVQLLSGFRNRHITEVAVSVDGGEPFRVALDERSLTPAGQPVDLAVDGPVSTLEIEVLADSMGLVASWGRPVRFIGAGQVGFAEVQLGERPDAPAREALVLPPAATGALDDAAGAVVVLTRWRADPTEALRDDPEPALARTWELPAPTTFELSGTAAPSPRAPDVALALALGDGGPTVSPSSRLPGAVAERGAAALDGDPTTWWSPSFADGAPSITVVTPDRVTFDSLDVAVVDDGRRSLPTRLVVEVDGRVAAEVEVPAGGGPIALPEPVTGSEFRFAVEAVDERTAVDWYAGVPVRVPVAIAELGIPVLRTELGDELVGGCRRDLLVLDGEPVPLRVDGGEVRTCDGEPLRLAAGSHTLVAAPGEVTGVDLDRLVLTTGAGPGAAAAAAAAPKLTVVGDGRASVRVRISEATPGEPFWLVLGQSFNDGWRLDGRAPTLVDGFANAWLVTPDAATFELEAVWVPQRVVTASLVLSGIAVVVALVLAVRRPRSGSAAAPARPLPAWMRATWVVPAAAATGSLLFIGPVSAVVVTAVAVAGVRWVALRPWLRLAPAAAFAVAAGYVLARQAIARPSAAFEWPAELETAHEPALVAVALLAVVVALDRRDNPNRG